MSSARSWRIREGFLPLGERPLVMGVLNVTPDSFSDGGRYDEAETAREQWLTLAAEGADIVDVGAESTRPGAGRIEAAEEIARLAPVLERRAASSSIPWSIDTYKSGVALYGLRAGARIVNDVWGLQRDAEMARVVAEFGAGLILMHNKEEIETGIDLIGEVKSYLSRSIEIAQRAGIGDDQIVVDPGVGFGKTFEQSGEMISRLHEIASLGFPVLVGASRKRFIGHHLGLDAPTDRLYGTLGTHIAAAANGADIIRVHDVRAHREALHMFNLLRSARS